MEPAGRPARASPNTLNATGYSVRVDAVLDTHMDR
jgi:hypothetical protein